MVLMRWQPHRTHISLSTKWETGKANWNSASLNYWEGIEAECISIHLITCNFRKKCFFPENITKSAILFEVFLLQPGSLAQALGFTVNLVEKVPIKGMFLEAIPWCSSNANSSAGQVYIYGIFIEGAFLDHLNENMPDPSIRRGDTSAYIPPPRLWSPREPHALSGPPGRDFCAGQ